MLKRERGGHSGKTPSIKNPEGKVVHNVQEILEVWKKHFAKLGTPDESNNFDNDHLNRVN